MGGVNNESGGADYASEGHDTPPNVGYLDQFSDTLSVRSESLGGESYISLVSLAGGSSKASPFQDVLASSTYGKFERAVSQLDINVDKDLPKIVVCGDESNGKSSTVARFICEEIFPASRGSLTTRMPIRVVLWHALERKVYLYHTNGEKTDVTDAPDISRYLKEEMDAVCAPGAISTQEIVVEIYSPGVYNAELIDLPGIVATEDLRDATEALVRSYISEPDVVIVCVVEAGLASLNNSRSLALVDALDKKQQTIVVLTKLDDIVEKNFHHVESRILEGRQYAGMVGVINRDDRDEDGAGRTLVEANAFEERWLRENLRRFLPGLRLRYNQDVGIFALLRKVDKLYHDVITQAWIPDAVHVVEQKMAEIQQREDALGPAPETYNGSITPLLNQFVAGLQCMGDNVKVQGNKFLRSTPPETNLGSMYSPLCVAQVRSRMEGKQLARKMASAFLKGLKDMVAEHAADVLDDGVEGVVNTAHLARFHEFGASVMRVLETKSAELYKSCWDEIEFLIDLRCQMAAGSVLPTNFHEKLHAGVVENVMSQFWLPLLDVVGNDDVDMLAVLVRESVEGGDEHLLLMEAQEVAAQRAMLKALYEKHQSALDVFSIIKRTPYGASWDTPDSPMQHSMEVN